MRTYKDLAYIREHLEEIINETTIEELEMKPKYEDTEYWFYVKTKDGQIYKIYTYLYVKWLDDWKVTPAAVTY